MSKKILNISFWITVYGILGLFIYWTGKSIIYSLYQPIYYSIFSIPSLITLLGFELFSVSCILDVAFKDEFNY